MTPRDRFDHAGKLLAEHGITLVVDTDPPHDKAWSNAVAAHGSRVAVIHEPGKAEHQMRHVCVWFDHQQPDMADPILSAFREAGCVADWSGSPYYGVEVDLNP